jgi:hypothetical protein
MIHQTQPGIGENQRIQALKLALLALLLRKGNGAERF